MRKVAELMPPLEGIAAMSSDDRRAFATSVADHIEQFLKDLQDESTTKEAGAAPAGASETLEDEVELWQSKVQLMVKVTRREVSKEETPECSKGVT